MTACSREPVYVEREIPKALTTPCAEPVKGPATEGGFAELALGWKHSSRCNADKLERIGTLFSDHNQPQ
jgi:hypothetical protein